MQAILIVQSFLHKTDWGQSTHTLTPFLSFLFVLIFSSQLRAQEVFEPHFAFSNYYGSGIYQTADNDVTILNLMPRFEDDRKILPSLGDFRWRVPVSLGLSNFDYERVGNTDLEQDASTMSIGLGIEKDYWDSEALKFVPFADVGYARDLRSHNGATTYAIGSSIFRYTDIWGEQQILFAKVQHAGFSSRDAASENFSSFQIGADLKFPERLMLGPLSSFFSFYVTSYYFAVGFDLQENEALVLQDEYVHELGFTWGLDKAIETSVGDIERIGFGYRFADAEDGVFHLAFNFPLD
ncbi:hypothetical protein A3715_04075 [Oleiphilus sp. HI0009]|nr:hypothetical protein A3715_04075 [Oleiphilus sp. HI0009]